uniref:Ubiquinol-cytochrome c reductase iron-sulfur subunit n=1 Tax=Sinorhizobium sp. M14 TaxID=430451 RepID=A0A142BPT0_9HYPH|nr:ubiquinol-cytochrome c reductase iron-sulfur subunit [Sinorhizobium sp. M14]
MNDGTEHLSQTLAYSQPPGLNRDIAHTHLGCIPLGQKDSDPRGPYGGWFCPCHGSIYDASGPVRKGPAPRNLPIPPYAFLDDHRIRIG